MQFVSTGQEFIFPLFFVMYSYSGVCIFNIEKHIVIEFMCFSLKHPRCKEASRIV